MQALTIVIMILALSMLNCTNIANKEQSDTFVLNIFNNFVLYILDSVCYYAFINNTQKRSTHANTKQTYSSTAYCTVTTI